LGTCPDQVICQILTLLRKIQTPIIVHNDQHGRIFRLSIKASDTMFAPSITRLRSTIATTIVATMLAACGGEIQQQTQQGNQQARLRASQTVATTGNVISFNQDRGTYSLTQVGGSYRLANNLVSGSDQSIPATTLRLRFPDITLALDIAGNAGQTFRLYQAAFNRVPDQSGLGYWINVMDNGASLLQIAESFIASAEFTSLYGDSPSDATFVNKLYGNVLHRAPDQGGLDYWLNVLRQGQTRAAVLISFSESPENQSAVLPTINNGIAFAETGIQYRPIANAGSTQTTFTGTVITLDGSASFDSNNDSLSYQWQVKTRPAGSSALLSAPTAAKPTFRPDVFGQYEFALTVNDGHTDSGNAATVIVNTFGPGTPTIADTGLFKCANLTPATALSLYLSGHTYLDRDKDGLPCEANDVRIEAATPPVVTPPVVTLPPVITPPVITTTPSTGGLCYVRGYRRSNGTYVSGYYRRC
jgi:hypothetical protein